MKRLVASWNNPAGKKLALFSPIFQNHHERSLAFRWLATKISQHPNPIRNFKLSEIDAPPIP